MRLTKRLTTLTLTLSIVLSTSLGASAAAPTGTLFPVGGRNMGVMSGPDGNLWFTKYNGTPNQISKMTLSGTVTDYDIPNTTNSSGVSTLTTGPDGNVWFTDIGNDKIGKITTGGIITEYDVPDTNGGPTAITAGPDGNLWFLQGNANYAGKVDPATGNITQYNLSYGVDEFGLMTAGPDGNLWFTDLAAAKIIRMSTDGATTDFPLSNPSAAPFAITTGPDGNLWFTEVVGNKVGKITPQGDITEYDVPANTQPYGITVGPDQNIWVSGSANMNLFKFQTDGTMEQYDFSSLSNNSFFIATLTVGPDGELWASDADGTSSLIQFTGIEHIDPPASGNDDPQNNSPAPSSPKTGASLIALMFVIAGLCAAGFEVSRTLSKRNTQIKKSDK